MSESVKQLLEAADESERVFGLRNQVVIAYIGGRKRNRRRTVQFIRELKGAVVGRVHYADETGTLQWMPVKWNPKRRAWFLINGKDERLVFEYLGDYSTMLSKRYAIVNYEKILTSGGKTNAYALPPEVVFKIFQRHPKLKN